MPRRGQFIALDFQRRVDPLAQGVDPATVDVEPDDFANFAEFDRQRQSDIAKPNDGNGGLAIVGKGHGRRTSWTGWPVGLGTRTYSIRSRMKTATSCRMAKVGVDCYSCA